MPEIPHRLLQTLSTALLRLYEPVTMMAMPERLFEVMALVAPGHFFHISVTKPGVGAVDAFLSLPAQTELIELAQRQHEVQQMPGVRDCSFYLSAQERPTSFHDLMDQATLESTVLWQVFCKPLDLEHDLSVNFHTSEEYFYTLSSSREGKAYTEEERMLLQLLHPHLLQRFRMLLAAEPGHPLGRQALSEEPVPYLICDSQGNIVSIGAGVELLLQPAGVNFNRRLPPDWCQWLSRQLGPVSLSSPSQPFSLEHAEGHLLVYCLRNNHSGQHRLVFEQRPHEYPPLTAREQQVARWLAEGKTNAEIGEILGISRATVKVHVERILAKIGVENRTAAALRIAQTRDNAGPAQG